MKQFDRTELEKFNHDIVERLLSKDGGNKRMINLMKLIRCFNDGCFDFSIYMFSDIDGFTSKLHSFQELVEFSDFYKSVDGDLSDAYFITEAQAPVNYVGTTDELVEDILTIVSTSLSDEESKELNVFLVKTFF